MKPEHLKEAEQIVTSLKWYAGARGFVFDPAGGVGSLRVVPPGFNARNHSSIVLNMTPAAAKAALAVMRREWDAREAELRRRAAQIGLTLEGL